MRCHRRGRKTSHSPDLILNPAVLLLPVLLSVALAGPAVPAAIADRQSGGLDPDNPGAPGCGPIQTSTAPLAEADGGHGPPRNAPPILHQLEILGNRFPDWLQTLQPLGSLARAPFVRRTRIRLEPEEMDRVEMGEFATADPLRDARRGNPQRPLRIVTWNIERGLQYEKIVQILKEELPADIYFLQEVDRGARRTEFRDVAASLACELQMHYAYGIEFQELTQGRPQWPALHGQATLSRFPITDARVLRFSNQPKDWSHDWFQPREGGRMALVTRIQTPDGGLLAYNTHLESRGNDLGRAGQMEEILDDLERVDPDGGVLLVGDLNTGLGLPSPIFETARLNDLHLIPFQEPLNGREARRQKDWILGAGVRSSGATLHHQISASDHKPVSAEVFPRR